jgi:hypothetical protein
MLTSTRAAITGGCPQAITCDTGKPELRPDRLQASEHVKQNCSYCERHTTTPAALAKCEENTRAELKQGEMVSGALYGGILRLLVKLIDARHVLDLGCFTGYGAVACVEAGALCAVVGRSVPKPLGANRAVLQARRMSSPWMTSAMSLLVRMLDP